MSTRPPKPMTPLDTVVTSQDLYSLKLILPYIPVSMQRLLAVYIKFQEFQNTLTYFQGFPSRHPSCGILDDLKPYMEASEVEMMEQMESVMQMMEMFSMYSENFDQELNHPEEDVKKGESEHE